MKIQILDHLENLQNKRYLVKQNIEIRIQQIQIPTIHGKTMEKKNKKPTMRTNCKEALELLERIKKNGGKQKLNKLGEWWATNPEPLFTWDEKDLKYIMR